MLAFFDVVITILYSYFITNLVVTALFFLIAAIIRWRNGGAARFFIIDPGAGRLMVFLLLACGLIGLLAGLPIAVVFGGGFVWQWAAWKIEQINWQSA